MVAIACNMLACVALAQSVPNRSAKSSRLSAVIPGHPECPSSGSCCVGHGAPGCNDPACCNIVCDFDYFCCIGWDADCASWAEQLCGSVCAGTCPGDGDC